VQDIDDLGLSWRLGIVVEHNLGSQEPESKAGAQGKLWKARCEEELVSKVMVAVPETNSLPAL
jgi:hypothetical protein